MTLLATLLAAWLITSVWRVICPIADWTWQISASSASCTGTLFGLHVGPPWQMLP